MVADDGKNDWVNDEESNVEYLSNLQLSAFYAEILDGLLMRPPFAHAEPRVYAAEEDGTLRVWNIKEAVAPVGAGEFIPAKLQSDFDGRVVRIRWAIALADYSLWTAGSLDGTWEIVSEGIETDGNWKGYSIGPADSRFFILRR